MGALLRGCKSVEQLSDPTLLAPIRRR